MEVEAQPPIRRHVADPPPTSTAGADDPAVPDASAQIPKPRDVPAEGTLPQYLLAGADAHRLKLFVAVLALYLLAFNGQWRVDADSALYLTLGRNLAERRGYTYHGLPHSLAYPGMPWLFAGLFKLFGTRTIVPADVVMLACALATLALVYRLFLLHAGRPTAVLMTVALALSRTFFRYSFELMSDMPFLMGVTAFLVGYEAMFHRRYEEPDAVAAARARPRWYDAVLLLAGLGVAMVTRPTMWALLAAVVASVLLSPFTRPLRRGWVLVGFGFVAAAVTAGVLFYALDPRRGGRQVEAGDYERVFLQSIRKDPRGLVETMLTRNLPEVLHPGAAEAVFGLDWGHVGVGPWWVPMGVVPSLLSIAAGLWLFRRRLLWGMWVVMTLLMMLATLVEVRYFLQVLPLLIYGWWLLLVRFDRFVRERPRLGAHWWVRVLPMTAFLLLLAINAGRAAYLIVEQRSSPFLEGYRRGKYALVPRLTEMLRTQTPDGAWVLVPERQLGRILTYTSGRYATEPGPVTRLNPDEQVVFVLEPLEPEAVKHMKILQLGVGEPVGDPVVGRRGVKWQLHRALNLHPPAEAPAIAPAEAPPP
jgi:hypothetical protein